MGIATQANFALRTVELVILKDGHPIPDGGIRLDIQGAMELIGKMQAMIQALGPNQQKIILPPGVPARQFQP